MQKAIVKKFIQLFALALILNTGMIYVAASSILLNRTRENLMLVLDTADVLLSPASDPEEQTRRLLEAAREGNCRYTLFSADGSVLLDTGAASGEMENHRNREEVSEALQNGSGSSLRYSDTLHQQMLYAAKRSADGSTVLRLSVPYSGMLSNLKLLIPALLLSFAAAFLFCVWETEQFSRRLSASFDRILKEMQRVDGEYVEFQFEKGPYEEINAIAETTLGMCRNLKEKQLRLEQERQIRQEFFSNASHELKTPLTSIRGYVELLEGGMAEDPEMRADFLKRIRKENLRMTSLVEDILMISRLESGGARAELVHLKAKELLEEAVSSLTMQAAERDILIRTECRNNFTVQADRRQMAELFTNLIGNAVKYNKDGGTVWVKLWKEETEMVLTVQDNGVGIPQESLERIFERFYRVDKGRSRKQGGTGLGLSIVKHVVNFYHGTVRVESVLGQGSTFFVRLPIAQK